MNTKSSHIPIDAVITWVNGNDTKWQQKLNQHAKVQIDFSRKKASKRYNSIGEIDIAIKSIIKYASFVKNIYLVTDDQKPESFDSLKVLAEKEGITLSLVDHTVIFRDFEECLPCFNSCSIGCMLFRIPNLSEHFIVFNDDTFLMRNTSPNDFFIENYPIIRGKWEKYHENRYLRNIYHKISGFLGRPVKKKSIGFKKFQQSSAKLAGTKKYVRRFHTPVSIRKSTLENFFNKNDLLKNNVRHRFRNENQFIVSSLSEHLEIKNKTYHFRRNTQLTYFRSYKRPFFVKLKLRRFLKNQNKLFMTFQSLEMADDNTLNYILNWVDRRIA